MKQEITNTIKTKSGIKLMTGSLIVITVGLVFFVWGLIRFLIINPTVFLFNTSNRRHKRRANKLHKLETKRQYKDMKQGGMYG